MNIQKNITEHDMQLTLSGRIDAQGAQELTEELTPIPEPITQLCFDFSGVVYISSAGLRPLIYAQKIMNQRNGVMQIRHVAPEVRKVFEISLLTNYMFIQ